jgi:hypothetical protein
MSIRLLKITAEQPVSKDESLDEATNKLKETKLLVGYNDYIRPMLVWAKTDEKTLAEALDVERVVPKGAYIMGLFGGEKKKGKEEYAGLVVEHFICEGNYVQIRLHGLSRIYRIPKQLMKQYSVNVYKLLYRGLINPFKCKTCDVLLSSEGGEKLRSFLKEIVRFVPNMPFDDRKKIERLAEEVKADLDVFEKNKPYVVYRCARTFTASVPDNIDNAVSESHVAYIICKNHQQAHYYAAVLNFLAYKIIKCERSFIRDQFTRPLVAVVEAGLSWKDIPSDQRQSVASFSEKLSKTLEWKDYRDHQDQALTELADVEEFKEIVNLLDKYVSSSNLKNALSFVSGDPKARMRTRNPSATFTS